MITLIVPSEDSFPELIKCATSHLGITIDELDKSYRCYRIWVAFSHSKDLLVSEDGSIIITCSTSSDAWLPVGRTFNETIDFFKQQHQFCKERHGEVHFALCGDIYIFGPYTPSRFYDGEEDGEMLRVGPY
jgi:hypothetical protein